MFIDFALEHRDDDTARLLLTAARYPEVDMPAAVQQIEGLRTAAEKWPPLLGCKGFVYPPRLNREQASSWAAAEHKAAIAARLLGSTAATAAVADLTGGMGIDCLALASKTARANYVERSEQLCDLMKGNCTALGVENIEVHQAESMEWLSASERHYSLLYLDPARRDAGGRKVAAFEDCQPAVTQHLEMLLAHAERLMIKASPMIDISLGMRQLCSVSEVHVVAVQGECKEVLFVVQSEASGEATLHCTDLRNGKAETFAFRQSDETQCTARYCTAAGRYIYEPNAALMKGGAYALIGRHYDMAQLSAGTHLYTSDELRADFAGRIYEVLGEVQLNRKAMRQVLPEGRAAVTVRNFPAEAAELQKRLGLREGGEHSIMATTVAGRRTGLLCRRVARGEGEK